MHLDDRHCRSHPENTAKVYITHGTVSRDRRCDRQKTNRRPQFIGDRPLAFM
ncbi:MAG: hypothetical protein WBL95_26465 [Microcoleus sp.]